MDTPGPPRRPVRVEFRLVLDSWKDESASEYIFEASRSWPAVSVSPELPGCATSGNGRCRAVMVQMASKAIAWYLLPVFNASRAASARFWECPVTVAEPPGV